MKIINGKIFDVCFHCGDLVRLDKPFFGNLHVCVTAEEYVENASIIRRQYERTVRQFNRA